MPFVYKIDDVTYELKYGSYLYDVSSDCLTTVSSISIDGSDNMILSSHVSSANNIGDCDDAWPLEPLNGVYFQDELFGSTTPHVLIHNEVQGEVYATYIGGSGSEFISNAFMLNENLFLIGISSVHITDYTPYPVYDPLTDAYFQESIAGGVQSDIFLSKICMDFSTNVNESSLPIVKEEFPFAVFPNPASSEFTVLSLAAYITLSEIDLLDISGRMIRNYNLPSNPTQQSIPISDLSTGIYIVRIRTNDNRYYSHKLVIK